MTVRIGSMATEWANSDIVYTAVGLHVTDNASSYNSKLINLSVDGNSKFTISKAGLFRITPDLPDDSSNAIFAIVNSGETLLDITPSTVHSTANVILEGQTNYITAYAEGLQYIDMGGPGELLIDLGVASTFVVDQRAAGEAGAITKITFVKPQTRIDEFLRSYSCSIVFKGKISIPDAVWHSANVMWPGGLGKNVTQNTSILSFINTTTANRMHQNEYPSNTWIAINSGIGFLPV